VDDSVTNKSLTFFDMRNILDTHSEKSSVPADLKYFNNIMMLMGWCVPTQPATTTYHERFSLSTSKG
jgi:hypothetical protein